METYDNYQRQCHFMSTFFRNVAYRGFARNRSGAMTAVSFVNVLRLLINRAPRVLGANVNEVPNSAVG